jgi:hypothetical protein
MRPREYDPSICEKVVEFGRLGKSRTWIAAALDIAKDTLYRWEKEYPEFSDALTRAKQFEQQWWEDAGQDNLTKQTFQSSVWSRSMAARFPDDWREKQDIDLNGKLQVTEIKRTIVDPRDTDA